jgi:uncharacterized protein Smg (DUF494 family)
MTTKIVDVLAKILEGLSNDLQIEEVNRTLMKNHQFDRQILGIAFSLIYDKVLAKRNKTDIALNQNEKGIRILSEAEKDILGISNYNYILHLINVGLLDTFNLEAILDQITLFPDNKISRREINWIILLSLVEYESEILPGSRVLLYSSDIVN